MRTTTPNVLDALLPGGPAVAAVPAGQPLQRRCADLRPHPLNETIYGDRADGDLIESIRQRGVLNPILVTGDNLIVSGHRRWGAAIAAGLETVPVVVYTGDDVLDIEEALIESNRQRSKTNEQIGREYKRLKDIYNERASRQGQRSDLTSVSIDTEVAVKPSEQAAAELGVSRMTAYRIEKVVDRIDELQAAGQPEEAAGLRDTLNRSVNAAHQQVRPARKEIYEIEQVVRRVAAEERATASDLRVVARQRIGRVWLECRKQLPADVAYRDLAQAINNVAEQMTSQKETQPPAAPAPAADSDLHTGAGRTPPPPLTVAEIVEELTPHLAAFAPGNIAGAALGLQNDVAERCALVLSDFTYQQTDLRRALQSISNARHLAMSKEASVAVANVDSPLPAWAEPEPATVAQTVADVVEVHGEPAPVAEQNAPAEEDSLYAELKRWWVRLISVRSDLNDWARLTGRYTDTLVLARELTKLLDITQSEMDAIATSNKKVAT